MRRSVLLVCVAITLSGCLFTQTPGADPDAGSSDTGGDGGVEIGPTTEQSCADGLDDDGDQLIDCYDPDCARQACSLTVEGATCEDGGVGNCRGGELVEQCGDDLDNDGDSLLDCEDPDCAQRSCLCEEAGCLELCDNQLDDDLDGLVNEDCACDYLGVSAGVCGQATQREVGRCVAPYRYQTDEFACDGVDNDCDGAVDEGCLCPYLSSSDGVCAFGVRGQNQQCGPPAGFSTSERCDGLDNDCNGTVDEGCDEPCAIPGTPRVGVCAQGRQTDMGCKPPPSYQAEEIWCDGVDNDCDGTVDERCRCAFNGSTVGACGLAERDVASGECLAPSFFQQEESICDGQDNDCDGDVDEGCVPCSFDGNDRGVCAAGRFVPVDTCEAPPSYMPDENGLCDGLDNDCDEVTDEGCPCFYEGIGVGACAASRVDTAGLCQPPPFYERGGVETRCGDAKDNDCDGLRDCDDPDCACQ